MKSLKYIGICIVVLGLFIGGMLASYFIAYPKQNAMMAQTQIQQTLQISTEVVYEDYESSIRLNALPLLSTKATLTQQEKAQIQQLFSDVLEHAKKDNFCQKGNFNLAPTFDYKDGQQVQKGHKIEGALECEIKQQDLTQYNALLKDLDYLALKSHYASLSSFGLRATIKPSQKSKVLEQSYDEALKQANQFAEHYATLLKKKCSVIALDLRSDAISPMSPRYSAVALSGDSSNTMEIMSELPLDTKTNINLLANISIACQ
ncbi:SIMPL domain-containing protein [Helicobacter fennelliae]|uniref:SIMPL domain-containing protein n=1 Tax=Helicobacter fennelliae TaxID=215 RepID=UPI000DFF719E|nr:SIMPL domain-containing protein [Helicobacter fennelliae]STQ84308.1 Uncharacterised protein [Helicobacter fennelliae]